jgi:preprotein translocase subunit YajC
MPIRPPSHAAFTLQDAPPAGPPPQGTGSPLGGFGAWPMLLLIFAIFYFVMIRPEGKKRREREAMLQRVKKGDKVMTSSGMYASVAAVQDEVITLQIADGVRVRFSRQAIQSVVEEESAEPQKPA